jgi:hypothetical protein
VVDICHLAGSPRLKYHSHCGDLSCCFTSHFTGPDGTGRCSLSHCVSGTGTQVNALNETESAKPMQRLGKLGTPYSKARPVEEAVSRGHGVTLTSLRPS